MIGLDLGYVRPELPHVANPDWPLLFGVTCGEGAGAPADIVSGKRGTLTTLTGASWKPTALGRGVDWNNSSTEKIAYGDRPQWRRKRFTVVAFVTRNEAAVGLHIIANRWTGSAGNSSWGFGINTSASFSPVKVAARLHDGSSSVTYNGNTSLGSPSGKTKKIWQIAFACDGATTGKFWLNGLPDGTVTTITPMDTDTSELALGSAGLGEWTGQLIAFYYFADVLRDDQVRELWLNPWAPVWTPTLRRGGFAAAASAESTSKNLLLLGVG